METCDWEKYCKKLNDAFRNKIQCVISNDNKECDAAVNLSMLENCSHIFMFCKKMSVFRDSFYVDDCNAELKLRKKEVSEALARFLKKDDSRLVVIVSEKPKSNDFISKDVQFKDLVRNRKIMLYQIPRDVAYGIPHFTIADDSAVRIENNDLEKTASCIFYNSNLTANCLNSFEILKSYASLINY